MNTNFDHALPAFIDEANELLVVMEGILLDLQGVQPDNEQLNAMFRAMHTIKGSSGLFGLEPIVHFTHEAENLLEALRSGELTFDEDLANVLLQCHDHVKAMLAVIYDVEKLQALAHPPLIAQLQEYFANKTTDPTASEQIESVVVTPIATVQQWLLSLRFASDVLCNGMDPLSFINYLSSIGTINAIEPVLTRLPSGDIFDPETNYLRFELLFSGNIDQKKLNDVFEFVRDDSDIHILQFAHAAAQFDIVTANLSAEESQAVAQAWELFGIDITNSASTSVNEPEEVVESRTKAQDNSVNLVAKTAADAELAKFLPKATKPAEVKFIKVEASKLDSLINLIGELVIAGASANLIARNSGESAQIESTATIATLIEQIRAGTLSMRMVQIGEIFSRFPRVVRDVSKDLGKQIELHISGAETELDKSMVDKLGDPLMHIVRNAIDHGVESADQRVQNGKAEVGNVWLNAYHESGSIVIEVADDGGGLRKDKIIAKAISNGLISADALLSDNDIYKLIFEPGFSTADAVSNISGRGVGMDVVKRGLEALRGRIDIDSEPGEGTHFRIRLPLTLAIIDGFLVQIGKSTFVIPLEVVVECIEIPDDLQADGKHSHLNLRGEVLPVLNLNEFFELGELPGKRQNVVVVNCGDTKAGLLVDNLLGEFQTVIKPLGTLFSHLRSISGSTILGSGEVALILDIPSLIHVAMQKESGLYTQKRLHSG